MLESLRKRRKIITIAIAFMFIGGMALMGVGSLIFNGSNFLGKINGKKVTIEDYERKINLIGQNWQAANQGKSLDDNVIKMIRNEAWNQLVREAVYKIGFKKYKVKVTNDMLWNALMNDTPEEIKSLEFFQIDGIFDKNKLQEAVANNPELGNNLTAYLEQIIPNKMLKDKITKNVTVTEQEVKDDYVLKNDLINGQFILFSPNKIKDVNVSDEEAKEYYENNKEDYKRGHARKLDFVRLNINVQDEIKASHILIKVDDKKDSKKAKNKIDKIYKELLEGADFAETAKKYSEGPTNKKGGDLGFFSKGRMVKEFEDVAFALNNGEISKPVLTKFGWHIIKKFEDKKADVPEEIKAKAEMIKNMAYEKGLKDAVKKEKDLAFKTTKEFYEDAKYIPSLGQNEELIKFAFEQTNTNKQYIVVKVNNSYVVSGVSYIVGDHYLDFNDEKNKIVNQIKKDKKTKEIFNVAKQLLEENKNKDIFEVAKKEKYDVFNVENIKADQYIQKIGKDEDFLKALFNTEVNQSTELFSNEQGAFLGKVVSRKKPDMKKFDNEKNDLTESMLEKKKNEKFQDWYNNTKDSIKIVDNREKLHLN